MQGLDWQKLELSLGAGLMQRADDRARQPPYLDIAKDIEFDEVGGIRLRKPYAELDTGAIADPRRVVEYGDELLIFTKTSLYSYSESQEGIEERATYLAVKGTETPRYVTPGDQDDTDVAILNGVAVHVWTEGTFVYYAISDSETGAVLKSATAITGSRPRIIALSTKCMLFYVDGSANLIAGLIDPADPDNGLTDSDTVGAAADFNVFYDATRLLGTDTAVFAFRRQTTTSYEVGSVDEDMTIVSETKARTCDQQIAIASHPLGTSVTVARVNNPSVLGDIMTIAGPFTDSSTAAALGSSPNTVYAVTAAYRSVPESGSTYRCFAFWTGDVGASGHITEYNYVDTAGSVGTETALRRRLSIVSRAFDHEGRVFVNLAFAEASTFTGASYGTQLQSTIFLYRDDGFRCGKFLAGRAGINADYSTQALLPGVQNIATNTYAWCAMERRVIAVAVNQTTHADRGPCDVRIEFDSNEARRCAQIGRTLYVTGSEVMQYDGVRLVEVGFAIYPWSFAMTEDASGSIASNSLFASKVTWAYQNATGERERSTTATTGEVTLAAQPGGIAYVLLPLAVTHKTDPAVAIEVWRTLASPTADSPFFLSTNTDPNDTSGANCFVTNAPTSASIAYEDELSDADIADREAHPENGALLESLAPPGATLITANEERVFLAGVSGDPDRVWYSKIRAEGEIAAFNDALVFDVPRAGGVITAISADNRAIVVWRERATYVYAGSGFGNFGSADGSVNFELARTFADCGAVNQESIAVTEQGWIFKSSKGWYLLNRGLSLEYIGAAVSDYDSETPRSVDVLTGQHQIRFLSDTRMLMLDTYAKQWCEWTISDAVHSCMWRGQHVYLHNDEAVFQQLTTYTGVTFGIDIETAWIKPADLGGWARIRRCLVTGEFRSAHDLRVRIAYDYDSTYVDDFTWTASPTTVGGPLVFKFGPGRPLCTAIKIRLTAQAVGVASPPAGEALKLTGLGLELGVRPGLQRRIPAAQKAGL